MIWSSNWPFAGLFGLIITFLSSTALLWFWDGEAIITASSTQSWSEEPFKSANSTSWTNKNAYLLDPPLEDAPFGAVVVATTALADPAWLLELQPNWTTFHHTIDDTQETPKNKGLEAMVYLSWIIDNYDSLPWSVVFLHSQQDGETGDNEVVQRIKDLRQPALARQGYVALRCDWYPSCPAELRPIAHDAIVWGPGFDREEVERHISTSWKPLFPTGEHLPETLASQSNAQFAVTRQAIWKRPKKDYEIMRTWLLKTDFSNKMSRMMFEKLWAYIFTGESTHCPHPQFCACKYFGHCEPKEWIKPPEGSPMMPDWP